MPDAGTWIVAVAVGACVVFLVLVAFQAAAAVEEWRVRKEALASLADVRPGSAPDDEVHASVLRTAPDLDEGFATILAERFPRIWDLTHLLTQSGLGWTLQGFAVRSAVSAAVAGLLGLVAPGGVGIAAVAFLLGAAVPWLYVRRKKRTRLIRIEGQLPEAIDLMARAVRAGHPLSEGLRMVAHESAEPLSGEFRATFEEQRFGLPFEEALLGLGDRVEVMDVRILITAILVQRDVGGNLAEILEKIAETMRSRFNLKRQVRVYTAQGRMSGYTLAALPVLVGLGIFLINPEYMRFLFDEELGRSLLIGAGVLQAVGFIWIRRIVTIEF